MSLKQHHKLYILSFAAACATFGAHWYGIYGGGYDLFDGIRFFDYIGGGYDIFMHILGGATVALLAAAVMSSFGIAPRPGRMILVAMAVGFAWEVFEATFGLAAAPFGVPLYFRDTFKDLCDDFIGAYIVSRLVRSLVEKAVISNK